MSRLLHFGSRVSNPFRIISRSSITIPDRISSIQTNGSCGATYNISRTACLLLNSEKIEFSRVKTYFEHKNSYESEWCSVVDGIEFALVKKTFALEIENNNKELMNSLMMKKRPGKPYVVDYFDYIMDISTKIDYLSVRWIPRHLNKADDLFRI